MLVYLQQHIDQVVTVGVPLAVLVLDVVFKGMFGKRDLHPFGSDLALCGFVLYLVAVLNTIEFGPEQSRPVIMVEVLAIIAALVAWFVSLFLCSLERWWLSLLSAALGLYSSSLCAESAWYMLGTR
jgi:hypothetical protein